MCGSVVKERKLVWLLVGDREARGSPWAGSNRREVHHDTSRLGLNVLMMDGLTASIGSVSSGDCRLEVVIVLIRISVVLGQAWGPEALASGPVQARPSRAPMVGLCIRALGLAWGALRPEPMAWAQALWLGIGMGTGTGHTFMTCDETHTRTVVPAYLQPTVTFQYPPSQSPHSHPTSPSHPRSCPPYPNRHPFLSLVCKHECECSYLCARCWLK